ncbi:MAG TPA: hypothetical protein PLJ62_06315 [Thermoflexales bacterium]|nr:hypothetical protein [Thermoflexales bacterium]HQZ21014.1 hypothetical protein [Thermoflexales bacterium]HQZ99790.1 hypothetical protein [Thermoflexales bacterium]
MRRFIKIAILVLLLLTPIFNIGEVWKFTFGGLTDDAQLYITTPLWVKLIKDGVMVLLMAVTGVAALNKFRKSRRIRPIVYAYLPLLLVALVTAVYTYITNENARAKDFEYVIPAGFRWLMPMFLGLFLVDWVDDDTMRQVALVCCVVFIFSFGLQIFQAFKGTTFYGRNPLGLAARVPGFFLMPATCGFFTCVTVFLSYFYLRGSPLRVIVPLLAPVSIFLCASSTALVSFSVMLVLLSFGGKYLKFKLSLLPLIIILVFFNTEALTGRKDFDEVSGPTRLKHFVESAANTSFLSNQFGFGTNAAVLANREFKTDYNPSVLDSTYASVMLNMGWLGAAAHALLAALVLWLAWRTKRYDGFMFVVIYSLFGFSQTFTESFPMNFIFGVWMGYFVTQTTGEIRNKKEEIAVAPVSYFLPDPRI